MVLIGHLQVPVEVARSRSFCMPKYSLVLRPEKGNAASLSIESSLICSLLALLNDYVQYVWVCTCVLVLECVIWNWY